MKSYLRRKCKKDAVLAQLRKPKYNGLTTLSFGCQSDNVTEITVYSQWQAAMLTSKSEGVRQHRSCMIYWRKLALNGTNIQATVSESRNEIFKLCVKASAHKSLNGITVMRQRAYCANIIIIRFINGDLGGWCLVHLLSVY